MNNPFGIDNEESAFGRSILVVVNAVSTRHRAFGLEVGQKRKVQVVVPGKDSVTPRAVHRYPEKFGFKLLKLIQYFVVERHLIAADRTPVGGIKCQDQRSSPELIQRYRLVRRATQREIGGRN